MSDPRFPLMPDPDHECAPTFVQVDDVRLHYERAGQGPPCVLLHGGFASHCFWEPVARRMRARFDVTTLDSRGQGRSSDGRGPITYGRMAVDTVRLLDDLGIDRAHVVGHSDGGCIALHLLVDHPDRLATATLVGTPLHLDDYRDGIHRMLVEFTQAMAAGAPDDAFGFAAHYRLLSPHPEKWPDLVRKLGATWRTQPIFSDPVLGLVEVPVLVIGVKHDEFLAPEVFERSARVFPRCELAWVAEGTHAVPISHPEAVADAVMPFVARHASGSKSSQLV